MEVHAKPLKVFILAGQSNMEGHAEIRTFDQIGKDPLTAPLLKEMRNPDGTPRVCDKVWMSYLTGPADGSANGEGLGKLTAGFGARGDQPTKDGGKIGPEFTFGIHLEKQLDQPILIIKTAWGGRSLNTEFRPPGAGPYQFNETQLEDMTKKGEDIEKMKAEKAKASGAFYRMMIEHVKKVLADPKRVCPEYDGKDGFEIAGFVWFQAWNDLVDGATYPDHDSPDRFALYTDLLTKFIRDVRKDLHAPSMPFVIGLPGFEGLDTQRPSIISLRQAMSAPAAMPEFKGNVMAVQTAPFWDEKLEEIQGKFENVNGMNYLIVTKQANGPNADGRMTEEQKKKYLEEYRAKIVTPADEALWESGASNLGYHYFGSAKTFAQIGKAFAEAVMTMQKK
jgi:alpha-galactosidase